MTRRAVELPPDEADRVEQRTDDLRRVERAQRGRRPPPTGSASVDDRADAVD